MLNFFKKKPAPGTRIVFTITGMHCTSCSMNIDDALEETQGVITTQTSYAKAQTVVTYDPEKISMEQIKKVIEELEYGVREEIQLSGNSG